MFLPTAPNLTWARISLAFDSAASVTFGRLGEAAIITDRPIDRRYSEKTVVKVSSV